MNPFYKLYCRIYQKVMYLVAFFLKWREPELKKGPGSVAGIAGILQANGLEKPLVVTDGGLKKIGMLDKVTVPLDEKGVQYAVYADTVPNPTVDNVNDAAEIYRKNSCDCLIALGGGSSMDCAKGVGALVANPCKRIEQMRGLLKVKHRLPALIAIPTTAGTGSETTLAAVISNHVTHEKYAMNDVVLIPRYAILDPELTVGLPSHITSTTGMDALTHAVEAYIGKSNTARTAEMALQAAGLIEKNLLKAYADGTDLDARECMQHAAYLAGVSFTRAYVGAIHAIAHTVGAHYGTPHGLACAAAMPHVLRYYGSAAHNRLADIADAMGVGGETGAAKANGLIAHISRMNSEMEIPEYIEGMREEDIPEMVTAAFHEANPLYPTPAVLSKADFEKLIRIVGNLK